jgi:dolichol-phosphate mannosyltransferase
LGILGEYVGRIYDEVKHRPLWIVRESAGISSEPVSTAEQMRPKDMVLP